MYQPKHPSGYCPNLCSVYRKMLGKSRKTTFSRLLINTIRILKIGQTMAYCAYIYTFKNSNEYEFKWAGNYGAKGEKRAPKVKATPEQIKRQNQWKREKYCKRVIKLNFKNGDLWCTILYPKGTRKPIDEVKNDMKKFLRKLRTKYKKRDDELKFVDRIEIGARGGIHIHMICNHSEGDSPIDVIIQEAWTEGRVHFERFGGNEEDYQRLADYIVKAPNEEQEEKIKEREDSEDNKKALVAYSSSRNLQRPVPERKEFKRRTVRKLIEDGPKPTPGYYIDNSSIVSGVNKYTGMSYLYYTEIKIDPGGGSG